MADFGISEALLAASVAASVGGGVVAAGGAAQQSAGAVAAAEAQQRAGIYNSEIMENNALAAERNRQIVLKNAEVEARDQGLKNRALQGQIRAAYGSSGFGVEGSPLDVLSSTAIEGQLDVDKILYKGDMQGAQDTDQANSYREQEQLYKMGSAAAGTAAGVAAGSAGFGIATGLLSGVTGALKAGSGYLAPGLKGGRTVGGGGAP